MTGNPQLRTLYERTYWDRLAEPSIFVPFLVLLVTIAYTTNIIDSARELLPPAVGERLWDLLVAAAPSSILFTIDDWLNPFPIPRPPADRASRAVLLEAKSSALGRLLGRDKAGGIIASVSYAGKSGLSRLMPKGGADRPAGLGNMSNSCYQNSILQALSALAPLRDYLSWIAEEEETGGLPHVQTAHTLALLVRDLSGLAVNGETLWTPPVLKRMSTFQQQDAQEYFCKLLNEVQEEVEKALKDVQQHPGFETPDLCTAIREPRSGSPGSEDSGYQSASFTSKQAAAAAACFRIPLEGLMAQRIVCRSCGYSSGLTMNPFYCLTLSLGYGNTEYRLEETLDSFSAVENIEGVQCASCTLLKFRDRIRIIISRFEAESGLGPEETRLKQPVPYERLDAIEAALEDEDFEEKTLSDKCKIPDKQRVESTKTRQVGIARAPPSIAFHINRSRFDDTTGYTFKNPAAIRFPLRLDLGPWCLGSAASRSSPGESDQQHESDCEEPGVENKEDNEVDQQRPSYQQSSPSSSSLPSLTTDSSSVSDDEEQWQLPPQLSMVSGTQYRSKITGPLYELRAVITHYGQHENGHYVCYRKHPARPCPPDEKSEDEKEQGKRMPSTESGAESSPDEALDDAAEESGATEEPEKLEDEHSTTESQWWRLSDQNVTHSNEAMALSQGGVFMLFYDRIDDRSVFRSSAQTAETDADRSPSLRSACGEAYTEDDTCGTAADHSTSNINTEGEPEKISYDLLEAVLAKAQTTPVHASHNE